ncbi:MAG TPA: hypothetical protein VFR37_18620 [Longimicrobium sp.]|nr:hypothetical protein [Longimicrobium sp.]
MRTAPLFRRILVRAAPLLLAAGCTPQVNPGEDYALLRCPPAGAAMAEMEIGPAGDVLRVRGHTFSLPSDAVGRQIRFRVRDRHTGYAGVDIEPHGTRFDAPAELTLSYAGCELPAGFEPIIVEVLPGTTTIVGRPEITRRDPAARTVTARLPHLSGYLVGGNRAGEEEGN